MLLIAAHFFTAAVLGSGYLPPEVSFIGNLLDDPSFEHGGDGGWTTDGVGATFSNAATEVRSGIGAAKVTGSTSMGAGGAVRQTVWFNASEGDYPTDVRVRACGRALAGSVVGCADGGCAGFALSGSAQEIGGGGGISTASVYFNPAADEYHCREIRVVSDIGIQQITIRATFEGLDGAVVFDDFDATVVEPYCWGETSYCHGVRTSWAGDALVGEPTPSTRSPTPPPTAPRHAAFVVTDTPYSAAGDGATDDTAAIQACIDAAAAVGGTVHVPPGMYITTGTLTIPAGVTVRGEGMGRTPLQLTSPITGSVITYIGTGICIAITGHLAGLRDLVLFDSPHTATAGIALHADGTGSTTSIESVTIANVLIYWFTAGVGIRMEASNGGGVAYCSFYDVRIRHALTAIEMTADANSNAFVNSNSFTSGAISGGGFERGIWIHGEGSVNQNVFSSIVVEMYSSTFGHLIVSGSKCSVEVYGSRFEASEQSTYVPIIIIDPSSRSNVIEAMVGHSFVSVDSHANPRVRIATGKTVTPSDPTTNVLAYAHFLQNFDKTATVDCGDGALCSDLQPADQAALFQSGILGWTGTTTISDFGISIGVTPTDTPCLARLIVEAPGAPYRDYAILEVTAPVFGTCQLKPSHGTYAQPSGSTRHVTFGAHVQTAWAGHVGVTLKSPGNSVQASSRNAATDTDAYTFVGMQTVHSGQLVDPILRIDNGDLGAQDRNTSIVVNITAPLLSYSANHPVTGDATSSAGAINKPALVVTYNTDIGAFGVDSDRHLLAPTTASIFKITGSNGIRRLNSGSVGRFMAGAVVTLVIESGLIIHSNAYIRLLRSWEPVTSGETHRTTTLLASGSGSWIELSRG